MKISKIIITRERKITENFSSQGYQITLEAECNEAENRNIVIETLENVAEFYLEKFESKTLGNNFTKAAPDLTTKNEQKKQTVITPANNYRREPLPPEQTCPECGRWKGPNFKVCAKCHQKNK